MKYVFIILLFNVGLFAQTVITTSRPGTLIAPDQALGELVKSGTDYTDSLSLTTSGRPIPIDSISAPSGYTLLVDYADSVLTYGDTLYPNFTKDVSVVDASFSDNFTVYYQGRTEAVNVNGSVIEPVNVFYDPINLIASASTSGNNLIWTDLNEQNIVASVDIDCSVYTDLDSFTNEGTSFSQWDSDHGGSIQVLNTLGSATWRSTYYTLNTASDAYVDIYLDAYNDAATTVWMVVAGWKDAVKTILYNISSENDTTFNYKNESLDYDSLRVYAQIYGGNLAYGAFNNFEVRTKTAGHDARIVKAQRWGKSIGGYWDTATPLEGFATLDSIATTDTTYFHPSSAMTFEDDTTKYTYAIYFYKDGEYSDPSNYDTVQYVAPTPSGNINPADIYLIAGSAGSWADRSDSTVGINIDTLNAYNNSIGAGKTIAVKGEHIGVNKGSLYLNGLGGILDNLEIISYYTDTLGVISLYDTLSGWSDASRWTDLSDSTWKFYPAESDTFFSYRTIFLNDTLFNTVPDTNYSELETQYALSTVADSTWMKFGTTYRWGRSGVTGPPLYFRVWTPDGSNPATYYNSIKQTVEIGTPTADAYTYAAYFRNIDNLTIRGVKFEGGSFATIRADSCDNITIDSCDILKIGQNGIRIANSDYATVTNDSIDCWGGLMGDNLWGETETQQGIDIIYNSDNYIVRGNTITNITTQGIRAYGRIYSSDSEYGNGGSPDHGIIDSNHVANLEGLKYARGMQIQGQENVPAWTPASFPQDTWVTRNYFENMTIYGKITAYNVYYLFNIYKGVALYPAYEVDHGEIRVSNDGYVFEIIGNLGDSTKYIMNNTFYNLDYPLLNLGNRWQKPLNISNNLFINMSRGQNYNNTDYIAYGYENDISIQNNYSFNDNTSSTDDKFALNHDGAIGSSDYITWTEWNALDGTTDTYGGEIYSEGNISVDSSVGLAGVLPNVALTDSTYNVLSTNSLIINSSKPYNTFGTLGTILEISLPAWLTKDRYGNTITGNGDNIGAINN